MGKEQTRSAPYYASAASKPALLYRPDGTAINIAIPPRMQLKQARAASVPERNQPWPYADREPPVGESEGQVRRVLGRFLR
jgi:hypothetical protein